jgi:hypothetical protein
MSDEPFTVEKTMPSGAKVTINATSAQNYVENRDIAELADKHRAEDDAAVDDDRNWFAARPKRQYRLRPVRRGEFNGHPGGWMLVARWPDIPGTRMRMPLPLRLVEEGYIDLARRLPKKKRDEIFKDWAEAHFDLIRGKQP